MSSWLARSLKNSLRLDDDGDDQIAAAPDSPTGTHPPQQQQENNNINAVRSEEDEEEEDNETQGRGGVKEDLDEIKQTLTRQFWGMASFLAPPPPPPPPPPSQSDRAAPFFSDHSLSGGGNEEQQLDHGGNRNPDDDDDDDEEEEDDANSDQSSVVERGDDDLRTDDPDRNSILSGSDSEGNQEPEIDLENAVGITEEVLTFAMNIAMHPETWLDFPIDEEEDTDDFDMSEAQQEHAAVIERLAPRLAALRIELCPCHMSEGYFWKVYFVLLHSRLNKQDTDILSTPQVREARAMWMKELHKQMKPEFEIFGRNSFYLKDSVQPDDFSPRLVDDTCSDDTPHRTYGSETTTSSSMMADNEIEKYPVESSGTHFIDKLVTEENIVKTENKDLRSGGPSHMIIQDYGGDDDNEWPEEDSDLGGYVGTSLPLLNEEDISFSDLEDDDYDIKHVSSNTGSKLV